MPTWAVVAIAIGSAVLGGLAVLAWLAWYFAKAMP